MISSYIFAFLTSGCAADLEFDYYDYDMTNASAMPGSLFGLDPTLMPWLPSILNIDEAAEQQVMTVEPFDF